jgi:membrane protein implicated in regulation of membrane protease activity
MQEKQEKRNIYYLAQRLTMGNLLLWFGAGAFRVGGHVSMWVVGAGFVYSLCCLFYYYYWLRRLANDSDA